MGLSIRLLGPPRIESDGAAIEVDTRKAIALLAYLAVEPGPQGRGTLAGLLWPDYEPQRARGSLRRTLSTLLSALGGRWVVADRQQVRLESADVLIDVKEFSERLAAAGEQSDMSVRSRHLTAAASLYRGDFLAGFSVRDSPEFEDWQFFTAESLRREFAGALETLTHDCAAEGNVREAIAHARRWLSLDSLHEPAHRALMTLYAWNDQRGPALRQFRECVRALERELGVSPLEATHELYRAIKENRLPPRPASRERPAELLPSSGGEGQMAAASGPEDFHTTSLVGRDPERAELLKGYERAREGWLAVVEGEAGIGRTLLVQDFAETVRERGGTAIPVRCFEGEQHLPYGPFVAAVRRLLSDPLAAQRLQELPEGHWAEASRMLPELRSRAGDAEPTAADEAGAQAHLLDAVTGIILAGLSADPPGVLIVDDVHWQDAASLTLLAYATRRFAGAPAGIVLTWRSDTVPQGHTLRRLVRESPAATHITLDRLARPDVDRIVDRSRPETDGDTRRHLWEETEGVPLFVVEYLAALTAGAELESWTMSGGVRDLLATRVAALSQAARQLLTTAAVIGRAFAFSILRDASGRGDDETVEGLEELLGKGLLQEEAGPGGTEPAYDFTHSQLRAYVLRDTSLARLRLLHRRVAVALSEQARGRRETAALRAQIAWHLQQAGDDESAAVHYVQAGQEARAVHANAEALAHFEAALALDHTDGASLHAAIADLHTLTGRYDEAVRRYETAAALATEAELPALEHRLGGVHHRLGEWELAEDHFAAALSLLGEDGSAGQRAHILTDASLTAHRRGERVRAQELADQALGLAAQADNPTVAAQAHNLLGVLASADGNTKDAVEHLERSLALATEENDRIARAGALNNLALALRKAGDVVRALKLAEEAVALTREVDDRHRLAAAIGNLGDLLRDAGHVSEAEAHVREAVGILAEIGSGELRPEIWKLTEW